MRKILALSCVLVLSVTMAACEKKPVDKKAETTVHKKEVKKQVKKIDHSVSVEVANEVKEFINNQMKAIGTGDIDGIINSFDGADKEYLESIKHIMLTRPTIQLSEFNALYQKDNEVLVNYTGTLMTEKYNKDANFNQIAETYAVLEKIDGKWKVKYPYIEDVSVIFVDEDGNPIDSSMAHDDSDLWSTQLEVLKNKDMLPSKWMDSVRTKIK